jgi:predicted kinase
MKLTLLVGPPGSGKSTKARQLVAETGAIYVNQDSQSGAHMDIFFEAVMSGKDIIVDRMNFNKQQRAKYIDYAKFKNPEVNVEIIVLHQPYEVCLERVRNRFGNHETINDEKSARGALQTFFTKYERPTIDEGRLNFIYPDGPKPKAIIVDLDGTLCNVEHRRHFVRPTDGSKKNWPAFFAGIKDDTVNQWCVDVIDGLIPRFKLVFCSGRDDNQRKITKDWIADKIGWYEKDDYDLYMRNRHDSRQDSIVKEIILDFELLTRYEPQFMIDDRKQVVEMWRSRGFTCLQCDEGDF